MLDMLLCSYDFYCAILLIHCNNFVQHPSFIIIVYRKVLSYRQLKWCRMLLKFFHFSTCHTATLHLFFDGIKHALFM